MGFIAAAPLAAKVAVGVSAATSIAAARQASAAGKFNQQIQNRNAQIAEQEAERLEQQLEFDLARFDDQFAQLQGETRVSALKSGVELSGSALRILRKNAEEAELQKNVMEYNSKVAQNQKLEEANFARMQGSLARQQGRAAAIRYYGQAGSSLLSLGGGTSAQTQQLNMQFPAQYGTF